MSAGNFVQSKYEASYPNGGDVPVHPIKVQPETLGAVLDGVTNTAPTGSLTSPISAIVSGSRRKLGLTPRKVVLEFTASVPTGYRANSKITIPCLGAAFYEKAQSKGTSGTYLGQAVRVVSSSPEYVS